ncbi:MAG: Ig-like domain-containing protein [Bacteroidales bacterium]|nr:Ig-like domain-containing protein [Bacteroidales bacterium]
MRRWLLPVLLATVLLLAGCAKVVLPSGGPRDTEPPKMLKEDPPAGSVNFSDNQIKITFDEFFTLNNPSENVLISPPLSSAPKYTTNGKSLIIKFTDTLQPHTTYNMVFSNCIKDFHESNELSYYHYSFSTGDIIDSFSIRGNVLDAVTLESNKDFLVMLYLQDVDSLPLTTIPDYVTKSLANGSFTFNNIAPGDYKLFALKDINANMLYDLPNEQIAYADKLVSAFPVPKNDSVTKVGEEVQILSFEKSAEHPQLTRVENPALGTYIIPYKSPVTNFSAEAIGKTLPYFESINANRDSIFWYMKEPLNDTLSFVLNADGQSDTIYLKPYKAKTTGGRGSASPQQNKLIVATQNVGHRFKPLALSFSYPIRPADSIPVTLICQKDTIVSKISVPDTFVKRLELPLSFEDKNNYILIIPDSVFWGYNGKTNDSIKTQFETHSVKDYGNLTMEYVCPGNGHHYIAQLWMDKKMIQENIFSKTCKIEYLHLDPGNYRVKVIEDANKNGRWDSGNYALKQQAERVWFFSHAISIRAFWDSEEQFVIQK